MTLKCPLARCSDCGCWLYPIGGDVENATCCNERCPSSWQAAKRDFETSLLGVAVIQRIAVASAPKETS